MLIFGAFAVTASTGILACSPSLFVPAVPASIEQQRSEIEKLEAMAEQCDHRADFHATLGTYRLQLGQFKEAALALEKALLIDPELAGAQLDFALALAALGQKRLAIDLMKQVSGRGDIAPELKSWLEREVTSIAEGGGPNHPKAPDSVPKTTPYLTLTGLIQSALGHESNLTSSPHAQELTLFLAGGPVTVSLDERKTARAGFSSRILAAIHATTTVAGEPLYVKVLMQSRRAFDETVSGQQFSRLDIQWGTQVGSGRVELGMSQQDLKQAADYAVSDRNIALNYSFSPSSQNCAPLLGISTSNQHYPLAESMDGDVTTFRAEVICSFFGRIQFGSTIGNDQPRVDGRPGGSRRKWDLHARHQSDPFSTFNIVGAQSNAWIRYGLTKDASIFNDLLAQSPNSTRRLDAGLSLAWPVYPKWEVGGEIEASSQQSNNALFSLKNRSAYVFLRRRF